VRGAVREPRVGADSFAAWPAYRPRRCLGSCWWLRWQGRCTCAARRAYSTSSNAGRGAACPGAVELARVHDSLSTGHRSRSSRRIRPAADSRISAAFSTAAP
jgi:hypothetical protein